MNPFKCNVWYLSNITKFNLIQMLRNIKMQINQMTIVQKKAMKPFYKTFNNTKNQRKCEINNLMKTFNR